jgi:hypothetical protein
MSSTELQPPQTPELEEEEIPEWIKGMKFCHLLSRSLPPRALCGAETRRVGGPCGIWYGEALCDVCGRSICPRCVQLDALEKELRS